MSDWHSCQICYRVEVKLLLLLFTLLHYACSVNKSLKYIRF